MSLTREVAAHQGNRRLFRSLASRLASLWRIDRPAVAGAEDIGAIATIKLRQPLALVVLGVLLAWYLVRPSAYSAMCTAALGSLLGLSYWWARRLALGLSARRKLNYSAVQVGDEIEELVYLSNRSALPALWVEFADHSNIPDYTLTSVRVVDAHQSIEWRAHAICRRRGNYRFGPWQLMAGDPFGLFQVSISYRQNEEILVYPPLADLPEQLVPRGRVLGDERPLHQPLQADSQRAFTARPYLPGDPLRHIHWLTTARREAPFVKVFDPEGSSTLWLIPDLDMAVQRGEGLDSTLETTVVLLASLADRLLSERLAVGLIAMTGKPQVVMPARGRPQLWMLLRLLAGLEAVPQPLAETLSQARALITGRQRALVVTPSLHPGWAVELQRLSGANWRTGAEVILLDPHSFAPGLSPPASWDAQLRRSIPVGQYPTAEAYQGMLASLGVSARILRRGELRPRAAAYGEISQWDILPLATGRIFIRHAPRKFTTRPPGAEQQADKVPG